MGRRSTEGAGLLDAFRAAVANLEAHVDEVNALNVFPVPDGDTGSNMLATVRAALDEAERAADAPVDRVAAAISFGALMGARGNSGVITSQILRGFSDALQGRRRFNALDLAHAFREGSRTAYAAVARPVEGTILTVVREAAEAAVAQAEQTNDIEAVLAATVDAAEHSVARTPSLLPILREAGVVDSGGQGLYRLLQGALQLVVGRNPVPVPGMPRLETTETAALVAHADETFGYETMFLLQARPGELLDLDTIRRRLEGLGESVLVAGDARGVKIHVHSERPDHVIAFGLEAGMLSRITIENLDHQARDVREAHASELATSREAHHHHHPDHVHEEVVAAAAPVGAVPVGVGAAVAGGSATALPAPAAGVPAAVPPGHPSEVSDGRPARPPSDAGATTRARVGIVAVAAGEGLREVFEQFAVPGQVEIRIVRGGQAHNPSTGELLEAIAAMSADLTLVLPNNPNVVLAARQVVAMAPRLVEVVPTRNAAEGVAALLALDPGGDAAGNVEAMTEAARAIQSVQVTEAVRDARIGDRKVRKGQTIALDPDDGLVAVDGDRMRAIVAAVEAFAPGYELLTVYYGEGADLDEAEAVARRLAQAIAGAEVQLVHGGQPYYRYLISAE